MEFFESIEEVEEQIELTRSKLELLEEDVTRPQALARLRAVSPFHPVLIARLVFVVLTVFAVLAAIGSATLPFVDPKLSRMLVPLETAIGLPAPLVFGLLAGLIGIAWTMATQASVLIGRECPLLPWEKKERERLGGELSRLTRQRQMMARVRGTPMGARPRLMTPVPGARRRTSTGGATARTAGPDSGDGAPSYAAPAGVITPPGAPRTTRSGTPLGAPPRMGTPVGSMLRGNSPTAPAATPAPARSATAPSSGARTSAPPRAPVPAPLIEDVVGIEEDTDQFHDHPGGTTDEAGHLVEDTEHGGGAPQSFEVEDDASAPPGQRTGREGIREDWLLDALEKAEILAESFPVQARLELNQAAGLPFTLILERATPAMAVRAMMAYVEFLASIAVPPKGRVELVSIPHLDRSFHRNIKAALEPYFPGTAEVQKKEDYVDIIFREPDLRWVKYPQIPVPE